MRRPKRAGFSLLELILALAILLGSIVVLGELARIGRRHAQAARDLTQAQLHCQNIAAAVSIGELPTQAVDEAPLPDADGWLYSIELEPAPYEGLMAMRVRVVEPSFGDRPSAEFALVRWLPDPIPAADPSNAQSPKQLPLARQSGR